ncbi:endonuclease-reverse transcriptase [Elysia marginata]|uniref:Endonuclease-reverse transcriptase n=1 Tax=Elysia marginata TaxID=1093978 RepID=A0AAV4GNF7_9GAST|nr:endonuclease-reverse transcriptase [Elysia marginata]
MDVTHGHSPHQSVNTKIKNSTTSDEEKNVGHQTKRSSLMPKNLSAHQRSRYCKICCKTKMGIVSHVARLEDNRWTQRVTEWQPRNGKRSRGRQIQRWRDVIVQWKGTTWGRDTRQRERWQDSAEGYILQWMNKAS